MLFRSVRAVLESVAYQAVDVLKAMEADSGINIKSLKADGGASANNFLMQVQADIMGIPVLRQSCSESTAAGAAAFAGLATGYWKNIEEIAASINTNKTFYPSIDKEEREKMYSGWKKAIDCATCFTG